MAIFQNIAHRGAKVDIQVGGGNGVPCERCGRRSTNTHNVKLQDSPPDWGIVCNSCK